MIRWWNSELSKCLKVWGFFFFYFCDCIIFACCCTGILLFKVRYYKQMWKWDENLKFVGKKKGSHGNLYFHSALKTYFLFGFSPSFGLFFFFQGRKSLLAALDNTLDLYVWPLGLPSFWLITNMFFSLKSRSLLFCHIELTFKLRPWTGLWRFCKPHTEKYSLCTFHKSNVFWQASLRK